VIQLTELQSMRDTLQRAIFSGTRKRQNVRIWHIGTHWAKQEFYDWLRIVLPDDGTYPPGYQHYALKDQDFYCGLCSESRIVRSSGKVEWVPFGLSSSGLPCGFPPSIGIPHNAGRPFLSLMKSKYLRSGVQPATRSLAG
jgi:Terminase large subunit gpA, endonuclease domain